jgi:hypothetical protein
MGGKKVSVDGGECTVKGKKIAQMCGTCEVCHTASEMPR